MSAQHDAWDLLPAISAPTLVLHGGYDAMTPASNAALLAERLPLADAVLHPDGRHGFFDELADDVDVQLNAQWRAHTS